LSIAFEEIAADKIARKVGDDASDETVDDEAAAEG
jgi:DNA-directed RNA polymerase subunit K/omega